MRLGKQNPRVHPGSIKEYRLPSRAHKVPLFFAFGAASQHVAGERSNSERTTLSQPSPRRGAGIGSARRSRGRPHGISRQPVETGKDQWVLA